MAQGQGEIAGEFGLEAQEGVHTSLNREPAATADVEGEFGGNIGVRHLRRSGLAGAVGYRSNEVMTNRFMRRRNRQSQHV